MAPPYKSKGRLRSPFPQREMRHDTSSARSPGSSNDDEPRGPLSLEIMASRLLEAPEKPPHLGTYDDTTDPDGHIENTDALLDYRDVRGAIKCRLFPTNLTKGAMTWYKGLPDGSITMWRQLCRMFPRHFIVCRHHPKSKASFEAIIQGRDESLREYIERFNKVTAQVSTTDDMKKYLLKRGLRLHRNISKEVGIKTPETWMPSSSMPKRTSNKKRKSSLTHGTPRT